MTSNQLRYWELRWKQWYEYYYLEELKRTNRAKEKEDKRHHKAQEVIDRLKIAIERDKVELEWQKLTETQRANTLHYLLGKEQNDLRKVELTLEEKRFRDKLLQDGKLALTDAVLKAQSQSVEDYSKLLKTNLEAVDKGWIKGGGAIALTAAQTVGQVHNYEQVIEKTAQDLGLDVDYTTNGEFIFGTAKEIKEYLESTDDKSNPDGVPRGGPRPKSTSDNSDSDESSNSWEDDVQKYLDDYYKGKIHDQKPKYGNIGVANNGTFTGQSSDVSSKVVVGTEPRGTNGGPGANISSNKEGGSAVIYSPSTTKSSIVN